MLAKPIRILSKSHRQLLHISSRCNRTFHSTMTVTQKITTAQRMKDGGTDKLDVWSIFTWADFIFLLDVTDLQTRERSGRLYQPGTGIHELVSARMDPRGVARHHGHGQHV